jgi:hypothetical protein
MHQPDLTNVPRSPLDYQNEIKKEYLSADDAIKLASLEHCRQLNSA